MAGPPGGRPGFGTFTLSDGGVHHPPDPGFRLMMSGKTLRNAIHARIRRKNPVRASLPLVNQETPIIVKPVAISFSENLMKVFNLPPGNPPSE